MHLTQNQSIGICLLVLAAAVLLVKRWSRR